MSEIYSSYAVTPAIFASRQQYLDRQAARMAVNAKWKALREQTDEADEAAPDSDKYYV